MKTKKIVALVLSMAMVLGVVAACTEKPDETSASDATTGATSETSADVTESSDPVADTSEFVELEVKSVTDEGDKVLIYGWNDEFPGLVTKYSNVDYDVVLTESNSYQAKLDQVLTSADEAPDMFVCDADYAGKYMNSANTIAINDIGIDYDELEQMYNYTLQFACDDNMVIKGLAWQACPCGVFYNRALTEEYLGVSEPEDVAEHFA
ncbi:MAG: extracellular solute-binding protein, partial [Clostridiales bacterium]|nr:extracellular solute-binding protein [Clostridiales bacterium]